MSARVYGWLSTGIRVDLYVLDCPSCGVVFAIDDDYDTRRRQDGRGFYCPNQHVMSYSESDTDRLKKSAARETALRDQLDAAVHDAESTRQALLRDRQRFAAGVCPCCNRSFENVRRHMTSQHPDYDVTKVALSAAAEFGCECGRSFESLRGLRIHQGRMRRDGWERSKSPWRRHLTAVGS